ncbi:hypothetical protein LTR64_000710 [Lithohypha guttulata]|uniref:uncharacterized protein n=1 Tax=Lithohypha guttulata TaxID=1690604 RepID=UPI002DE07D91|nr:hypothetical protein LTR51_005521 [Lithohypha guttulata]
MGGGNFTPAEHEEHLHWYSSKLTYLPASGSSSQGTLESNGKRLGELSQTQRTLDTPSPPAQTILTQSSPLQLRVITHNIRYAATSLFPHEEPWPERLPYIQRQLYHYVSLPFNPQSSIVCLQEVLHSQLQDLASTLNAEAAGAEIDPDSSTWSYVGVGRDDGGQAGEYNPIFYRHAYWKKIHFQTIWLSETPETVSRGWDGGCNRICTCLVLETRLSTNGKARRVMILNTHLDNAGPVARREGAKLIVRMARRWRQSFRVDNVVLTGDLNSMRDEKDGAWEILNAMDSGFVDSTRLLDGGHGLCIKQFGPEMTFTGFDGNGDGDEVGILDFVHLGVGPGDDAENLQGKLHAYTIIPNIFEGQPRCSDHTAVVVDFLL